MTDLTELCFKSANDLSLMLRARDVSAREVMQAHLEQIERTNPKVNAICTLVAERALAEASLADNRAASERGPLFGLPIGIKDLARTRGITTTYGSPIYKNFVPSEDDLHVARLKRAGAIIVGKTNTPEFGAGSQTFNAVFGETRNPYDPAMTCGGSSGGSAVALASGMVPLADGSDLGGSLRNPASFCNVVGFRPSIGRVPQFPKENGWESLGVVGPMGRAVEDVALLMSVMAGPDDRDPIAIAESGQQFQRLLNADFAGALVAWSPEFGGYPFEKAVVETCARVVPTLAEMGVKVEQDSPDVSGADEVFQVLRAALFAGKHYKDLKRHREDLKDTVVWNIEQGLKLNALVMSRAQRGRTVIYQRVREFLEKYEFLLLPVSQALPFPVEQDYAREINGVKMATYIDWMASCYVITLTGLPAVSVPCGFSESGLPVGLQIVGRHQQDVSVLQLAFAIQEALRVGQVRPELASS